MYYAIRNTAAKGVYTNKELFKEKLKQYKGCSFKEFTSKNERDKALEWAGVRDIADAKQQVVPSETKKKPIKKVQQTQKQMSIKEIPALQQIFDEYKKLGYKIVTLHLPRERDTSGYFEVHITLQEHYYDKVDGSLWPQYFDNRERRNDTNLYYNKAFYEKQFEGALQRIKDRNALGLLSPNKYKILGDFLFLKSYGAPQRNGTDYSYTTNDLTINIHEIIKITASGHWGLNNRYLNLTSDMLKDFKANK